MELANATKFGLVAGVWTRDGARQFRMARRVRSGQVFINNYGAGGGVELPFGGVKSSGYGREKGFEALLRLHHTEDRGDPARLTGPSTLQRLCRKKYRQKWPLSIVEWSF